MSLHILDKPRFVVASAARLDSLACTTLSASSQLRHTGRMRSYVNPDVGILPSEIKVDSFSDIFDVATPKFVLLSRPLFPRDRHEAEFCSKSNHNLTMLLFHFSAASTPSQAPSPVKSHYLDPTLGRIVQFQLR